MTTVNTKTAVRRRLRFETLDELLAEIERLNTAERAGRLRRSGNWTFGQTLGHLATWIDYSYEGYPLRVPWFVRFVMRFKVKRYLRDGMESGLRIPRTPGGTYGIEALETEEGMQRLRAAVARLQSEPV
ncbi:MAG: DUF1569 domain-containing protein [Phycisphaerales bacterium]|nr:DUF1569 domain-containing protein [Phycisphaerales bacterium]